MKGPALFKVVGHDVHALLPMPGLKCLTCESMHVMLVFPRGDHHQPICIHCHNSAERKRLRAEHAAATREAA